MLIFIYLACPLLVPSKSINGTKLRLRFFPVSISPPPLPPFPSCCAYKNNCKTFWRQFANCLLHFRLAKCQLEMKIKGKCFSSGFDFPRSPFTRRKVRHGRGVARGQRRTGGHFENFIQMLGKLAIAKTAFCWRYMTAISITGSLHFGHIQKLV